MASDLRNRGQNTEQGQGQVPYSDHPRSPRISDEVVASDQYADETHGLLQHQSYRNAQKVLAERADQPQNFTLRGIAVGIVIGVVICFSNVYFGLQTGWISGMSMPSALISYGFFKSLSSHLKIPFSPVENVLVQSVAGSVGVMPLGAGLVGVIPALEFLLKSSENGPLKLDFKTLCIWSVGTCFFGVLIAVPLRKQVIIREKLKFPSGSATALMIAVLHGKSNDSTLLRQSEDPSREDRNDVNSSRPHDETGQPTSREAEHQDRAFVNNSSETDSEDWRARLKLLLLAFLGSSVYTIFTYFVPQVRSIPIFGTSIATNWLWVLNPSPAYVGQGIIMGPATCTHMLIGAIIGWGILSPLAKDKGWAPGPVSDWERGSKGWIVWVSLAIMFADAIISLGWLILRPLLHYGKIYLPSMLQHARRGEWGQMTSSERYTTLSASFEADETSEADAPAKYQIGTKTFFIGLALTLGIYFASVHLAFGHLIPLLASFVALIFTCILSIMSIRALGETDLNPISGISKLTQLFFAFVIPRSSPNAIIINLMAGAITESGALQAGDLLQDLKTGHLLGAAPYAQFYGQLIGSTVGAIVSVAVYKLYTSVYTIPGGIFQIPTAYVWIFTARLVNGRGLPQEAGKWAICAGAIFVVLTIFRTASRGKRLYPYIPGGIAVAIGMYNEPNFTLARFIGGMITAWWTKWRGRPETNVVILASGLILGEGLCSIINLLLASGKVPHL